mgnify:CR=1 FL=1
MRVFTQSDSHLELKLAKQLGNVSQAFKVMGYGRNSHYQFIELYMMCGDEALQEISRKKPILKNRVPECVERSCCEIAVEFPAYCQLKVANGLRQQGILISPCSVRSVSLRYDLETLPKRLEALETKGDQDGIILSKSQLEALEKQQLGREAHIEIDSEHSGYLGSQDTYYAGTFSW